jgi:hypothetical protein
MYFLFSPILISELYLSDYCNQSNPSMNAIISILASHDVFLHDPRGAILLRTSNKRVREEFDRNLHPVTWWFWIQYILIPKIMGLPSDLKPEFYMLMLQKYFAPASAIWKKKRPEYMYRIGSVLYDGCSAEQKVLDIICVNMEFTMTAKGRALFMGMVEEWGRCFGEDHRNAVVVREIKQFIKYSFLLRYNAVVSCGHKNQVHWRDEALALADCFAEWQRR